MTRTPASRSTEAPSAGGSHSAIEQEIRFLVPSASLHQALARLRRLGVFQLAGRRRERQRNTYFDTADLRLRRARAVLKLREVGTSAQLIFKQRLGYRKGVARHLEVAMPLTVLQRRRFLAGQCDGQPIRRARAFTGLQGLQRRLVLCTDRRRLVFAHRAHRVELDVDQVSIRIGVRVIARRREVELENLTASPALFTDAQRALRRQFPGRLRVSRVSKYEYGLAAFRTYAGRLRRAGGRKTP